MNRRALAACAVALLMCPAIGMRSADSTDARTLPMQFDVWTEGPAQACGTECRTWVSATGAITADTPRDFEAFAANHSLKGMTIALDSDGGSVLGALAFGRAIRKLGMTTTVGKTVDLSSPDRSQKRARLLPRAYCESMCAFVLLGGVVRSVPAEARVLVHQIWLGDRRDDPTAANYSAEDLVLVQRDIGRLAQYTMEMASSIDLLEIALKIPPWEPMRLLTRDELRGMSIVTLQQQDEANSGATASATALASGARAPINGRSWAMAARGERPALARKHPLTVEGDDIGVFELTFACGETSKDFVATYTERRHGADARRMPSPVTEVELSLAGKNLPMQIVSSKSNGRPFEIETVASGRVPAELLSGFAVSSARSLTVETVSEDRPTVIRVGNAGVSRTMPQLAAACAGQVRTRNARNEALAQPR